MDPMDLTKLARLYTRGMSIEATKDGSKLYGIWLKDLPGCRVQGPSEVEALDRFEALVPVYLARLLEMGRELPRPTGTPAVNTSVFLSFQSGESLPIAYTFGTGIIRRASRPEFQPAPSDPVAVSGEDLLPV